MRMLSASRSYPEYVWQIAIVITAVSDYNNENEIYMHDHTFDSFLLLF
jgi:hypothetical protein